MLSRPRRLRRTAALRDLVAETRVTADALIQPHFVIDDDHATESIDALPGIERTGVEPLLRRVESDLELGIRNALLFGVTTRKDSTGSAGADPEGALPRAITALKRRFGDALTVFADVCLCTYTDHGHCGVIEGGDVANDATLPHLVLQAVCLAEAGADCVAPSDMMDGRVRAIREGLDARGLVGCGILSYAAKFASAFYGPFRVAADSAPRGAGGPRDRKGYQMDPRNAREAVREARLDAVEGADMLMVKPALAYLDVIARVRAATDLPLAAYLVSGEYAALELLAREGLGNLPDLVREHFHAVRRAGADVLITYHGRRALQERWL